MKQEKTQLSEIIKLKRKELGQHSSQAALPGKMRATGERESVARIALQRKGVGKKLRNALRLMGLPPLAGRTSGQQALRPWGSCQCL